MRRWMSSMLLQKRIGRQQNRVSSYPLALGRQGKTGRPPAAQRQARRVRSFMWRLTVLVPMLVPARRPTGPPHSRHAFEHLQQAQVHVAELAQHGAVFGGCWFYLHKSSVNMDVLI